MRRKQDHPKDSAEKTVSEIRRATRRRFSAEEKIRTVREGLGGGPHCGAVPAREDQPEAGLPLVEGVFGGGQEAPNR